MATSCSAGITRRALLQAGAATAVLAATGRPGSAEDLGYVDAH